MGITLNYYKIADTWYLDLPEYLEKEGAREEDLERLGAFHDFLELASEGRKSISLEFDLEPKKGSDPLVLTGLTGEDSGAYYHLHHFRGKEIDLEIWFNHVLYHFVETPPEKVYLRQVQ